MSSLRDKIKELPRISIEADEQFVVEIKRGNVLMAELICSVQEIGYNFKTQKSTVELTVYNIDAPNEGMFATKFSR